MVKKRTIITIILTICIIVLTNKFWLVFKPMPVDFDINGQGKCNIEVQLNKKDNDKFDKIKTQSITLDLNKNNHVSFNVERARFPKRIKFVISGLKSNSPIEISNITLRNGKYKLDDLKQFISSEESLIIKNNSLVIYPDHGIINLEYKKSLNVRTAIKFDFKLFVIILILTYLLTYKLSNYVADFKSVKEKSRIDIIFLTIFFIFLFIPMSHINQDEISKQENRRLAKCQPFITQNGEINYDFGKNFNEWFNDRFYLRESFIKHNDFKLIFSSNWQTKNVIKGKNNWLFLGWNESIESYSNIKLFSQEELDSITSYLSSINNYCKKNNKKFYFFIAPDKSKIYEEFYPDRIKKISKISKTEQLIEYLNNNSDIKVIYPQTKLIQHKKEGLLYYKSDTHWNLLGAYYGYEELMKNILSDFPTIDTYKTNKFIEETHNGDLYNMTPKILRKHDKTVYKVPSINNDVCTKEQKTRDIISCNNSSKKYNILMFRDSFTTSLIPYLSHTFKKSKYCWVYNVAPSQMEDADIIILEVVERYLPVIVNNHME